MLRMYIAHGPISYILNETIQRKRISKLDEKDKFLIGLLSLFFGILPDIDLLILSMTNIPPFQHHTLFTHSILFYIILWSILNGTIFILKKILNKKQRTILSDNLLDIIQKSFLIGVMSHLFADILFSYSIIFFPLQKQFTILGNLFKTNYFASYIFTPPFAIEILLLCIFFLMIYKKYIRKIKILHFLIYICLSLSFIFFLLSTYMNLNIYNKGYYFENGCIVGDTDFDGIDNKNDPDVDNMGKNNLLRINTSEMIAFTQNISTGKYFVSGKRSLIEKVKYSFGSFDSYRLISQAYFEQNLPIEPVLKEYALKNVQKKKYNLKISYPDLLYEYITLNFKETDIYTPGGIIFITNSGDILNMGIVVEDKKVGMVFEDDTRLILHDFDQILTKYKGRTIRTFLTP
jgi:hypothetical protein